MNTTLKRQHLRIGPRPCVTKKKKKNNIQEQATKIREKRTKGRKLINLSVRCLKMLVTMPLEKRHRELYGLQIKGMDCVAGPMKEATQGSS